MNDEGRTKRKIQHKRKEREVRIDIDHSLVSRRSDQLRNDERTNGRGKRTQDEDGEENDEEDDDDDDRPGVDLLLLGSGGGRNDDVDVLRGVR
jgi:hypothetical protein